MQTSPTWINWALAGAIFIGCFAVLWGVKRLVFWKWFPSTKLASSPVFGSFVRALAFPLTVLIFGISLIAARQFSGIDGGVEKTVSAVVTFTMVLALVLFLDRSFGGMLHFYGLKMGALRQIEGIVKGAFRGVLIGFGVLILLDSYGISITPFLASLGVGSLAVALAMQDTLANFFAGVQIVADKQIRIGDFIRMESGEEGFVEKLGWRSTQIRLLPNTVLVVPNNKLTNTVILNYDLPEKEMSVLVQAGVHYDSDLKKVEQVTVEVARDVLQTVQGGVKNFDPFIRYHTFADFSINFTVILRAQTFVDQYLLKHEFIKRLHERYRKEGIVIPYPIRTVELREPLPR